MDAGGNWFDFFSQPGPTPISLSDKFIYLISPTWSLNFSFLNF